MPYVTDAHDGLRWLQSKHVCAHMPRRHATRHSRRSASPSLRAARGHPRHRARATTRCNSKQFTAAVARRRTRGAAVPSPQRKVVRGGCDARPSLLPARQATPDGPPDAPTMHRDAHDAKHTLLSCFARSFLNTATVCSFVANPIVSKTRAQLPRWHTEVCRRASALNYRTAWCRL
jgi:hypothetical protein